MSVLDGPSLWSPLRTSTGTSAMFVTWSGMSMSAECALGGCAVPSWEQSSNVDVVEGRDEEDEEDDEGDGAMGGASGDDGGELGGPSHLSGRTLGSLILILRPSQHLGWSQLEPGVIVLLVVVLGLVGLLLLLLILRGSAIAKRPHLVVPLHQ